MDFSSMFARPSPFESMFQRKKSPFENVSFQGTPDTGSDTSAPEPGYAGRDNKDFLNEMRDVLMTTGPRKQAYEDNLEQMPVPGGSGKLNRTLAAIAGGLAGYSGGAAAGLKTSTDFVNRPYENAMESWKSRQSALGQSAQMEEDMNSKRAQFANLVRQTSKDDADYDMKMRQFGLSAQKQSDDTKYKQWQMSRGDKQDSSLDAYRLWQQQHGDQTLANTQEFQNRQLTDNANYRTGMLGVAQKNANTNVGNLEVNKNRANDTGNHEANQDAVADRRANTYADAVKNGGANKAATYVNPTQQVSARKLAIKKALDENPGWKNFVSADTGELDRDVLQKYPGKYLKGTKSGGQDFLDTVKAYENDILKKSRLGMKTTPDVDIPEF